MESHLPNRLPSWLVLTASSLVLVLAAWADALTVREAGFEIVYALPVLASAWYLDRMWGLGFATLAAAVWLFLELYDRPAAWDPVVSAWNALGHLALFVVLALVVSALRESVVRNEALARTDDLTGLGNASVFHGALRAEVDRSKRTGAPLSAAVIEMRGVERVAAAVNEGARDRLLRETADLIRSITRKTDVVCRLEDDEFGIVFPETDRVAAGAVLLKVVESVSASVRESGWDVTPTVGAVTVTRPPDSWEPVKRALADALSAARAGEAGVVEHRVVSESLR